MKERHAQIVLLVRALEESDSGGASLPHAARDDATRRTLEEAGVDAHAVPPSPRREWIVARARRLRPAAEVALGELEPHLERARLKGPLLPLTIAVGFAVGAGSHVLDSGRHVDLLGSPLLGVLIWNLAIFATIALRATFGRRLPAPRGLAGRASMWLVTRSWRAPGAGGAPSAAAEVWSRFAGYWLRAAARPLALRLRGCLHAGAASVAAGALAGLYARGLAFEFRATWESTWLDAGQVQALMGMILGPASAISGIAIPDVRGLEGSATGQAAPWLHLWAITVVGFVIVPRALLATHARLRATLAARRLDVDVDAPYFRKSFASARGAATRIRLVPYSFEPSPAGRAAFEEALHECFGARAAVSWLPAVSYGDDVPGAETAAAESTSVMNTVRILVFNLAQTPEAEVHGAYARAARARATAGGERFAVAVDVEPLARRIGSSERRRQRERAWRQVLSEANHDPVFVYAAEDSPEAIAEALGGTLGLAREETA